MISQILSVVSVAVVFMIAQTLASPDLVLSVNNASLVASSGAEQNVACYEPKTLGDQLADTKSCLQAAISLPEGADPGIFHSGGLDDGYRLPKIKIFGSCMAKIEIKGPSTDRSSWDHISYVASQMAAICVNGNFPRGSTGGVRYAGYGANIRVTLGKKPGPGLGGNNDESANLTATS